VLSLLSLLLGGVARGKRVGGIVFQTKELHAPSVVQRMLFTPVSICLLKMYLKMYCYCVQVSV
jgi:hypothetical protein